MGIRWQLQGDVRFGNYGWRKHSLRMYGTPFGVWLTVFLRNLKWHLKRVHPPRSIVAHGNFKNLLERKQGLNFAVMETSRDSDSWSR